MQVKSAVRVLDLIRFLSASREPVALRAVVGALGLPKSSAHALCQTLVASGYATQDRAGAYTLLEANRHGFPYAAAEEHLVEVAHPVMRSLRDATDETVILSTMTQRGDIRRLAKCISRQAVRYDVELDAPIASYCTATGRVLLAFREPERMEACLARASLLSYTAFTRTEVTDIRAILDDVRRDGFAVNDEEFVTGSTGIAAPILDEDGTAVAALNLGTLSQRYRARRDEFIEAVRTGARTIGQRLSSHPVGAPAAAT